MQQSIPWGMDIWVFELLPWWWCLKVVAWEIHVLYRASPTGRDRGEPMGSILFPVNMECIVYRYWLSMSLLRLKWEFCYDGMILKEETKWQFEVTLCYFQCQTTEVQLFRKQFCFRKRHIGNTIACQVFDIKNILLLIYCILKYPFNVYWTDIPGTLKMPRLNSCGSNTVPAFQDIVKFNRSGVGRYVGRAG